MTGFKYFENAVKALGKQGAGTGYVKTYVAVTAIHGAGVDPHAPFFEQALFKRISPYAERRDVDPWQIRGFESCSRALRQLFGEASACEEPVGVQVGTECFKPFQPVGGVGCYKGFHPERVDVTDLVVIYGAVYAGAYFVRGGHDIGYLQSGGVECLGG